MDLATLSRTLRSNTSSPNVAKTPPVSELTVTTKGSTVTSKLLSSGKRKGIISETNDDVEELSSEDEEETSNKRQKVEQSDIDFNIEEKKYVIMKVRSGDTITSPCWSSKLCQVASLTKEGIPKSKYCVLRIDEYKKFCISFVLTTYC